MSKIANVIANLGIAVRLATFDKQAVEAIDDSHANVWRSFVALPFALVLNALAAGPPPESSAEGPSIGLGWYAVAWLLALVIASEFARHLGKLDRIARYIVARNWTTLIQAFVVAVVAKLLVADDVDRMSQFPVAVAGLWTLVYDWFVAKHALSISGAAAAALVAMQVVALLLTIGFAIMAFTGGG